jgi:uncharacterized protein
MAEIKLLNFQPLPGLSSKHLQTVMHAYLPSGLAPDSTRWIVELGQGDILSCEVSTPPQWKPTDPTILLIHGLGSSHNAGYMVRMARKTYARGYKVVRINLRGCGSGEGLSKLPYHAGTSQDVFKVLQKYKIESPLSKVTVIGFSLGANVALKLAGELGEEADKWIERCFAVCSPIDLKHTVFSIGSPKHYLYQLYYMRSLAPQTSVWTPHKPSSIYELDRVMTAPLCGFESPEDYYQKCSSLQFLPRICVPANLVFAVDDPFIDISQLKDFPVPDSVKIWATTHGGHLGFLGCNVQEPDYFWMDQLLLHWLDDDFTSDALQE